MVMANRARLPASLLCARQENRGAIGKAAATIAAGCEIRVGKLESGGRRRKDAFPGPSIEGMHLHCRLARLCMFHQLQRRI